MGWHLFPLKPHQFPFCFPWVDDRPRRVYFSKSKNPHFPTGWALRSRSDRLTHKQRCLMRAATGPHRRDGDLWLCWRCVAQTSAAALPREWRHSAGAQPGRRCSLLCGCTGGREVALFPLCSSGAPLPGLDLTIHLGRLCGISRRQRAEDCQRFWTRLAAELVSPLGVLLQTIKCLSVSQCQRHGCHGAPTHTSKWEAVSPAMTACVGCQWNFVVSITVLWGGGVPLFYLSLSRCVFRTDRIER